MFSKIITPSSNSSEVASCIPSFIVSFSTELKVISGDELSVSWPTKWKSPGVLLH